MSVLLKSLIFNIDNNMYNNYIFNISIRYHLLYVSCCLRLPATLLEQPWRSTQDRACTTLCGKSQVPTFEPDEGIIHDVFVLKWRTDVDLLLSVFVCVSLIRSQFLACSPRGRKHRHIERNHEHDQIQAVNHNKTSLTVKQLLFIIAWVEHKWVFFVCVCVC